MSAQVPASGPPSLAASSGRQTRAVSLPWWGLSALAAGFALRAPLKESSLHQAAQTPLSQPGSRAKVIHPVCSFCLLAISLSLKNNNY